MVLIRVQLRRERVRNCVLRSDTPAYWTKLICSYQSPTVCFHPPFHLYLPKKREADTLWEETSENQVSVTGLKHAWAAAVPHNLPTVVISWPLRSCSDASPTQEKSFPPGFPGTALKQVGACRFHPASSTGNLPCRRG